MNEEECPKCHRPMNMGNSPNKWECTETDDEDGVCEAYTEVYRLRELLRSMPKSFGITEKDINGGLN